MSFLLLALCVSAPSEVEPIPPALVPPTAVAGAAIVLGVDAAAHQKSKTLREYDEGTLRELQATVPRFGQLRRELSLQRGGRRVEAVRAEEPMRWDAQQLLGHLEAREDFRIRPDRPQHLIFPRNPENTIPPGCLVLILPPGQVHPVIREALRK